MGSACCRSTPRKQFVGTVPKTPFAMTYKLQIHLFVLRTCPHPLSTGTKLMHPRVFTRMSPKWNDRILRHALPWPRANCYPAFLLSYACTLLQRCRMNSHRMRLLARNVDLILIRYGGNRRIPIDIRNSLPLSSTIPARRSFVVAFINIFWTTDIHAQMLGLLSKRRFIKINNRVARN